MSITVYYCIIIYTIIIIHGMILAVPSLYILEYLVSDMHMVITLLNVNLMVEHVENCRATVF